MTEFSSNLNLSLPLTGEFPGTWAAPLNENFNVLDALFGSTGHGHTGLGDGAQINHFNLLNVGVYTHAQLDAHLDSTAIHSDTRVSLVSDEALSVSVINVTDMRFANSMVEQLSSGAVLITPQGTASTQVPLTAPVVFYDAFTGASGLRLGDQGWDVLKTDATSPEYSGTTITGQAGAGIEMIINGGGVGYVTNLVSTVTPHSWVQRVGVTVDTYGSDLPSLQDVWVLNLHLLGSNREETGNSPTAPIEAGLSFVLRAQPVAGELKLIPGFSVRSNTGVFTVSYQGVFPAPPGWVHPDGFDGWGRLPLNYFKGSHEFSLSILNEDQTEFTLSYYYNAGLIFQQDFKFGDGAFYDAVIELLDDLKEVETPSVSDYGMFGFSTAYSLSAGSSFAFKLDSVMASSVGEQDSPGVVTVPDVEPPTSTPVCGGDPAWAGVTIPGFFDPDAAGGVPSTEWSVISEFPGQGLLSAGFIIQNSIGETQEIYCSPPDINNGGEHQDGKALSPNDLVFQGLNLPMAGFSDFRFYAFDGSIPSDWANGNDGSFFSPGQELPSSFLRGTTFERSVSGAVNSYDLVVAGGRRLPWNSIVSMKANPQYQEDSAFTAEFPEAVRIVAANPVVVQTPVYQYDTNTGIWVPISETDPVCEGEVIAVAATIRNLPLGPRFWNTPGTFSDGYGIGDTVGAVGTALTLISSDETNFELLWSRIITGKLIVTPGSEPIEGDPPPFFTPTSTSPGVGFALDGSDDACLLVIGRIHPDAWNAGQQVGLDLAMRDTENQVSFTDQPLVRQDWVCPTPPKIDPAGTNINNTGAGTTAQMTIVGEFFDSDMTITPLSGIPDVGTSPPTWSESHPDVTITKSGDVETWVIENVVLSSVAGENIRIELVNQACLALVPASADQKYLMGVIGETPSTTPIVTYAGGTLQEGTTQQIQFSVTTASIENGTTVSIPVIFQDQFAVLNVDKSTGPSTPTTKVWLVDIQAFDTGGTSPSSISVDFTNPLAQTLLNVSGIPVTAGTGHTIESVNLGTPTGPNTWDVTDGTDRIAWVRISNITLATLADIQPTSPTGSADVVRINSISWRPDIHPDMYRADLVLNGANGGDTIGLTAYKTTKSGVVPNELNPAISFLSGIGIGNLVNAIGTAQEGRYVTFNIPGQFETNGSNLIVDFVDGGGNTLRKFPGTPALITTETPTLVSGSMLLGDNIANTQIFVKIEYISTGLTETATSPHFVGTPPSPVITSFTVTPNLEGSTGVVVEATGDFLAPPVSPVGQPPLSFTYTLTTAGGGASSWSNILQTGTDINTLGWTADLTPTSGGTSVGLDINFLGGNVASFPGMVLIQESGTQGDPIISSIRVTGANGGDASALPLANTFTEITLEGSGLGSYNVAGDGGASGIQFTAVGHEFALYGSPKIDSPPGAGLHVNLARSVFKGGVITSQSNTKAVVRVAFNEDWIDSRVRVHLIRPSTHASGSGEWLQAGIDNVSPTDVNHRGLTIAGPPADPRGFSVNGDSSVGITRLTTAKALQAAAGPGSEGSTITLLFRVTSLVKAVPKVLAITDPVWNVAMTNISVASTASPFEFLVTATLPSASDIDNYPSISITTSDPVIVGLKLSNGIPIASATIGAVQWSTPALEQQYFDVI